MQTRGNRVFTGGPKTNPQPPATPAGWLFSCPEEVRMLHGVDVHARYQAGLQASTLAGVDFVITKATGGTSLRTYALHFRFDR